MRELRGHTWFSPTLTSNKFRNRHYKQKTTSSCNIRTLGLWEEIPIWTSCTHLNSRNWNSCQMKRISCSESFLQTWVVEGDSIKKSSNLMMHRVWTDSCLITRTRDFHIFTQVATVQMFNSTPINPTTFRPRPCNSLLLIKRMDSKVP